MTRFCELSFHLTPTATFKVFLIEQLLVQFSQSVNRKLGKAFGLEAHETSKLSTGNEPHDVWDGMSPSDLEFRRRGQVRT